MLGDKIASYFITHYGFHAKRTIWVIRILEKMGVLF